MKCLETEKLIGYAYRLTDEPAALQVRAHLGECSRCREIVEQYGRLDAVLNEWKAAEPTLGFDARVRQAVEAQQAKRDAGGFWGWQWVRGLALASLGILIVAGVVWFTRSHPSVSDSSPVAAARPQPARGSQAQATELHAPAIMPHAGVTPVQAVGNLKPASAFSYEDKDAQALEDYDLAANFDLLSELPKGEPRVAN